MKDDSRLLSKVPTLTSGRTLSIEISSPLEPAALELAVFRGDLTEINPAAPPDVVIDLMTSGLVSKSSSAGALRYTLDRYSAEITGKVVIGIFTEYYADSARSHERFINTTGWVFSLDSEGG